MPEVTSREELRELLQRPQPTAFVEGLFARAPQVRTHLGPCTLGQVCGWAVSPTALAWRDGVVHHDPAAAVRLRLQAVVWSDPDGTPLFAGDGLKLLQQLPAGVIDRLVYAADRAAGYAPGASLSPVESGPDLLAGYATGSRLISGLLPLAPEAEFHLHAYDFATFAAAEDRATVTVPGGELRLEVLAFPTLLAASLRCGPDPDSPRLVDEALARELPYGTARALVEAADDLSEIGGPELALRFLDHPAGPGLDGPGALAAATDGAVSQ